MDEIFLDLTASTILSGGGAVRIWFSATDDGFSQLQAQVFDQNLFLVGSTIVIDENTGRLPNDPNVIGLSDGGFLVTWGSSSGSGTIFVARYDDQGQEVWAPTQIASGFGASGGSVSSPEVVETANGNIFVVWEDTDLSEGDVFAVQLDEDGNRLGSSFRVNSTSFDQNEEPSVTALQDGGFVVIWRATVEGSFFTFDSQYGVYGQVFDDDGNRVGEEFVVEDDNNAVQPDAQVAALATGGFVVVYDAGSSVVATVFDENGNLSGDPITIADSAGPDAPWVAGLTDGTFIVAWSASDIGSLFMQRYDQDGSAIGNRTTLDTQGQDEQFFAELDVNDDGLLFVHWQYNADEGFFGLAGTTFQLNVDNINEGDLVAGTFGDDSLSGSALDDTLLGGSGDDTLSGGGDGDILNGGSGTDTALYLGSSEGIDINLAEGTASGGDAEGDTLQSVEYIIGSNYSDRIVGDDEDNYFEGSVGSDTLDGGDGADTLDGGFDSDTLIGGRGEDTLDGGEGDDVLFGGTQADRLDGGEGADSLLGGNGNDTVLGGSGSDTLSGSIGDDSLNGGSQGDRLFGDAGADTLNGAGGADRVDYLVGTDAILVDLETGEATGGFADGDVLISIESLFGGKGDDTLRALEAGSRLNGAGGDDIVTGRSGDDFLAGGNGNDVVTGGSGDDLMNGNRGDDTLDGGAGDDTLRGSTGADTFVFSAGAGDDIVLDFRSNDMLDLSATTTDFTSLADVQAAATETEAGLLIDLGGGDSVLLAGATLASLVNDNLVF